MNKVHNMEKGEFFKYQVTILRRNGKFFVVTWEGVRGQRGSGMTSRGEDTIPNLLKIKSMILNDLKSSFEIEFEGTIYKEKAKEQLKKLTKKSCYEKHLLTDDDWVNGKLASERKHMENVLSEAELIRKRFKL